MKLSYPAFVVALVGTSYRHDSTSSITAEAFVPHLHYARYQQRIANTQLHYVNDDDISELAFGDLMEMKSELVHEDGDDMVSSTTSSFPLVKQMASFVASEFLKRQSAIEVDPIRFFLTSGVLPETMTLAQQSSHLSVLAAQTLLLGAVGEYQVDFVVKEKNPSPTTIVAQVSSTQQNSSDGLPSTKVVSNEILLNHVDPAVPFFAKPKASTSTTTRPTPFFAKLPATTITTTTSLPIDPIELQETLSKDMQDGSKVVLAWPTILTPEMTVQQALDHVQSALGGIFSTTASKAAASISNVLKESSTMHPPLAEPPRSIEQQVVQPAKEWLSSIVAGETVAAFISKNSEIMTPAFFPKSTLNTMPTTTSPSLQDWMKFVTVVTEEVTTQAFDLARVSQERVSTFFGSSSRDVLSFLPRTAFLSRTTPRPVTPRPPHSPPSEDLLASQAVSSYEDESTSTSACLIIDEEGVSVLPPSELLKDDKDSTEGCVGASIHQELDLQDIDDVLREAEWALKVADAAFQ